MEAQAQKQLCKPKSKILKFLPKAASSVYFHSVAPYSPKRSSDKPNKGHRASFSGSLIPEEARRKPRRAVGSSSSFGSVDEDHELYEPNSPKISCMGQIKHKKQQHHEKKQIKKIKRRAAWSPPREIRKHTSAFQRMFSSVNNPKRKSDAGENNKLEGLPDRAPSLSQMTRFASGRGQDFASFDWQAPAAKVAPRHDDDDNQNYHSEEEREDSDHECDYVGIAFSAPLMVGGSPPGGDVALQPRKEINLWKRRTMAPPTPLHLKLPIVKVN